MRKNKIVILILIIALISVILAFALTGCSKDYSASEIQSDDLTRGASISDVSSGNGQLAIDSSQRSAWNPSSSSTEWLVIDFLGEVTFNSVAIKEKSPTTKVFHIQIPDATGWRDIYLSDGIGGYRFCSFDNVTSTKVRLMIDNSYGSIDIRNISVYNIDYKNIQSVNTAFISATQLGEMTTNSPEALAGYLTIYSEIVIQGAVTTTENGGILYSTSVEQLTSLISNVRSIALQHNLAVNIMLDIASNIKTFPLLLGKTRTALVLNIINIIKTTNIDGVNLDWTGIQDTEGWRSYSYLIQSLSLEMKLATTHNSLRPTLSLTLTGNNVELPMTTAAAVDYINYFGSHSYEKATPYDDFYNNYYYSVNFLTSIGFRSEQINMGISFFGKSLKSKNTSMLYSKLENANIWQNLYININFDGSYQDYYFNSPTLVRDKAAYTLAMHLRGVAINGLNSDLALDSELSLSKSLNKI